MNICDSNAWPHAYAQKVTICEKEFAENVRFLFAFFFFQAHPALGDMAGSCEIQLLFGSLWDRNHWSCLLSYPLAIHVIEIATGCWQTYGEGRVNNTCK